MAMEFAEEQHVNFISNNEQAIRLVFLSILILHLEHILSFLIVMTNITYSVYIYQLAHTIHTIIRLSTYIPPPPHSQSIIHMHEKA